MTSLYKRPSNSLLKGTCDSKASTFICWKWEHNNTAFLEQPMRVREISTCNFTHCFTAYRWTSHDRESNTCLSNIKLSKAACNL